MSVDTLDSLAAEANALGLLINNLFQLHVASVLQWQANFRLAVEIEGVDVQVFGRGTTYQAALRDALDHARKILETHEKRKGRSAPKQEEAIAATHESTTGPTGGDFWANPTPPDDDFEGLL